MATASWQTIFLANYVASTDIQSDTLKYLLVKLNEAAVNDAKQDSVWQNISSGKLKCKQYDNDVVSLQRRCQQIICLLKKEYFNFFS